MKTLLVALLAAVALTCVPCGSAAETDPTLKTFDDALVFFKWLESHAEGFGHCKVDKAGKGFVLCDGTEVDAAELRELLALAPDKLVARLKDKGLTVDVLCETKPPRPAPFHAFCSSKLDHKMFAQTTALHGEYLPGEKRILLREGSSVGTAVHEYLHSLEEANANPIYGKVYKKERLAVQAALTKVMDAKIAEVHAIEKSKDRTKLSVLLKEFSAASDLMRGMARWQDFIDERSLFLLYLRHGKELGVSKEDEELARKNIGFVCKNPGLRKYVTDDQCAL
ncbi:MAG: hypothetical protein HY075_07810 [Deltaproteobacteria bacterium]|nr:hypothetical protein [Deltaproteobacteria bacterium]